MADDGEGHRLPSDGAGLGMLVVEVVEAFSRTVPVDVAGLARVVGVATSEADLGDARCALRRGRVAGTWELAIPRGSSARGRRWAQAWAVSTVACQGDLVPSQGVVAHGDFRTSLGEAADRGTNLYAAEVLMPWRALAADAGYRAFDVEAVARRFEVGRAVARLRMVGLRRALASSGVAA